MVSYRYAYLIVNLFYAAVWLFLFFRRKGLRKQMLVMSFGVSILAFSQFLFIRDYWQPQYFSWESSIGLEDFLFSFLIGGIAAVIYENLFGKKYLKRHLKGYSQWMLAAFFAAILWIYIGNIVLGFNTMYVTLAGLIFGGSLVLFMRHDLLKDAFFSGLLIALLMFVLYLPWIAIFPGIIQKWWLLKNLSGIIIFGVPLEEIAFGFWWGFFAGPLYEFVNGIKFRK